MQNTNNLRVSPHYIGVPQYLIDTRAPIDKLFGEAPERPEWHRVPAVNKIGYQAVLLGDGYCEITRLNVVHQNDSRSTDEPYHRYNEPVKYSTCETLDFWKSGLRDGWETLYGGELFTIKNSEARYGFVHSDQIRTYLFLKSVICTLIPLGYSGQGIRYDVKDYDDMFEEYLGIFLVELRKRPRNPNFSKRKRQIVFV